MAGAITLAGHMMRALRQMEQRLKVVDLIVEVRDARLPLSSANEDLARMAAHKRRLVLLNKADLADPRDTQRACALLRSQGLRVLPASAVDSWQAGKVLDAALSWLRAERGHSDLSLVLVAGLPNTGKSSLINGLKRAAQRQGLLEGEQAYNKTARSGPLPGVTLAMGGFKVCRDPQVFVLDTPGVVQPTAFATTRSKKRLAGSTQEGEHRQQHHQQQQQQQGAAGAQQDPRRLAALLGLCGLLPLGAVDELLMLRCLVQVLTTNPHYQRQLWCAADGQLPPSRLDEREGGPSWSSRRRHSARDRALALALYRVVAETDLPPARWHPGLDDDDGSVRFRDGFTPRHRNHLQPAPPPYGSPETDAPADPRVAAWPPAAVDAGDSHHRVDQLLHVLSRGASLDLGQRAALVRSVLDAFRRGSLGRYTLDDVRGAAAAAAQGNGVGGRPQPG